MCPATAAAYNDLAGLPHGTEARIIEEDGISGALTMTKNADLSNSHHLIVDL